MNPVKEIPAIDDNGFHLTGNCAIAQYLCDKYAPDNDLYPKDIQKRAQVNRMMFFFAGAIWPSMRSYATEKPLLKAMENMNLLNTLIGNKKYVATDHLTIADLYLYTMIISMRVSVACKRYERMRRSMHDSENRLFMELGRLSITEIKYLDELPNLIKWYQTFSIEHL